MSWFEKARENVWCGCLFCPLSVSLSRGPTQQNTYRRHRHTVCNPFGGLERYGFIRFMCTSCCSSIGLGPQRIYKSPQPFFDLIEPKYIFSKGFPVIGREAKTISANLNDLTLDHLSYSVLYLPWSRNNWDLDISRTSCSLVLNLLTYDWTLYSLGPGLNYCSLWVVYTVVQMERNPYLHDLTHE